jgi:hypothetical protein
MRSLKTFEQVAENLNENLRIVTNDWLNKILSVPTKDHAKPIVKILIFFGNKYAGNII